MRTSSSIHPHRLHWPSRQTLIWIGVVLAFIVLTLLWVWGKQAERRAVRRLPPAERAEVYQRTLRNVESVCIPPQGLNRYCESQAQFLSAFPECDASCRRLVRQVLDYGKATR